MFWMPGPPVPIPAEAPKTSKAAPTNLPKMLTQECPKCKVRGAYIGLSHRAECINPGCENFTQKWADDHSKMVNDHQEKEKEVESKVEQEAKSLLSEEFGLDWNENEVTTEDMVNMMLP